MSEASAAAVVDGKPTGAHSTSTRAYTPQRAATSGDPEVDAEVDALTAVISLDRDAQLRVVGFVADRNGKRVASKRAGTDSE